MRKKILFFWYKEKWLIRAVSMVSFIALILSIAFFYFANKRDDTSLNLIGANIVATKYNSTASNLSLILGISKTISVVPVDVFDVSLQNGYESLMELEGKSNNTTTATIQDYISESSSAVAFYNKQVGITQQQLGFYQWWSNLFFLLETAFQLLTITLAWRLAVISSRK